MEGCLEAPATAFVSAGFGFVLFKDIFALLPAGAVGHVGAFGVDAGKAVTNEVFMPPAEAVDVDKGVDAGAAVDELARGQEGEFFPAEFVLGVFFGCDAELNGLIVGDAEVVGLGLDALFVVVETFVFGLVGVDEVEANFELFAVFSADFKGVAVVIFGVGDEGAVFEPLVFPVRDLCYGGQFFFEPPPSSPLRASPILRSSRGSSLLPDLGWLNPPPPLFPPVGSELRPFPQKVNAKKPTAARIARMRILGGRRMIMGRK